MHKWNYLAFVANAVESKKLVIQAYVTIPTPFWKNYHWRKWFILMTMTDDKGRKKASQSLKGLSYERDFENVDENWPNTSSYSRYPWAGGVCTVDRPQSTELTGVFFKVLKSKSLLFIPTLMLFTVFIHAFCVEKIKNLTFACFYKKTLPNSENSFINRSLSWACGYLYIIVYTKNSYMYLS